jgi:hypothetical protein
MRIKLPSYALVGIEAVPVDVIVDGERVKVVEPESGHTLHSVSLGTTSPGDAPAAQVVNAHTPPGRNLAPARSIATPVYPISPIFPDYRERNVYY